ncbi:hypothetical protein QR680_014579 [Steinernema hermaphroditum]|uniref:Uncharacterized protein n=1 Tax=Steinernema hermaphroditum TaxID=289476 RepID=A0AA39IBK8_9BILA|nr:hypothetical protein QR680_014579 [Steinernema hermaphroditum]
MSLRPRECDDEPEAKRLRLDVQRLSVSPVRPLFAASSTPTDSFLMTLSPVLENDSPSGSSVATAISPALWSDSDVTTAVLPSPEEYGTSMDAASLYKSDCGSTNVVHPTTPLTHYVGNSLRTLNAAAAMNSPSVIRSLCSSSMATVVSGASMDRASPPQYAEASPESRKSYEHDDEFPETPESSFIATAVSPFSSPCKERTYVAELNSPVSRPNFKTRPDTPVPQVGIVGRLPFAPDADDEVIGDDDMQQLSHGGAGDIYV